MAQQRKKQIIELSSEEQRFEYHNSKLVREATLLPPDICGLISSLINYDDHYKHWLELKKNDDDEIEKAIDNLAEEEEEDPDDQEFRRRARRQVLRMLCLENSCYGLCYNGGYFCDNHSEMKIDEKCKLCKKTISRSALANGCDACKQCRRVIVCNKRTSHYIADGCLVCGDLINKRYQHIFGYGGYDCPEWGVFCSVECSQEDNCVNCASFKNPCFCESGY